jgi:alginate O-acetyltransferase complex protein AlgJ
VRNLLRRFSISSFNDMRIRSLSSDPQVTPKHTLLCAAVFGAMMAFGAYQIAAATFSSEGLEFPRSVKDFREGTLTQTLEKQLDHKMPIRHTFIAVANSVRYQLFGGGGEQVRVGKKDWLFLTDELRFEGDDGKTKGADPSANLKVRLDLIAEASQRLKAQGVHLVLALVPDKARMYSEQLKSQVYPSYNQSRYVDALNGLRTRKVLTVNLLEPLEKEAKEKAKDGHLYYRTDTHWNQRGARIAAREISAVVANLKLDLERSEFFSKPSTALQERPGDLIRLMGLEHVPNALRPLPDQEAAEVTVPKQALANQGLFGDSAVPVVLSGTSYSMRGNFHGYLQEFLAAKVLNTAKDGGGFLQAMTAYLSDDAFKAARPKVLIWEVPERMLRSPITDETQWLKKVAL